MRRVLIGVSGPGETATDDDIARALALGQAIAREGWVVLTGGRDTGVMDAACRGARRAGGLAIGLLPSAEARGISDAVDIAILTGMGEARNVVLVQSSAALVVCGMSAGTASEVALALKARRPVILLRPSPETRAFAEQLSADGVRVAASVDEVMEMLRGSAER